MKRRKNRLFTRQTLSYMAVVFFGVLLYFLLSNLDSISGTLSRILSILSPFISGAIIAFLLDVPMRFFENKVFAKFRKKRALAIVMAYLSALVAIFLLFWIVVPQIIDSARSLVGNIGMYLDNLNELMDNLGRQFSIGAEEIDQFRLSYEDILNQLLALLREILPDILNISMRIGSGIISLLTALIASIYMLASKDRLFRQCRRTLYAFVAKKAADELVRIFNLSVEVFSNFISGKILDSAIIGVICFVGMSLMNAVGIEMPFIPLISVIIAVTNIIPYFGPFIGAIPSAMIILIVNPVSALWFTLFITLLQQFDGNILGPRILGDSTGLPPLWVLVAIIVGGGLFGLGGMVAGVPAVAVLHTLIHELVNSKLKASGFNAEARYIKDDDESEENGGAEGSAEGAEDGAEEGAEDAAAAEPPGNDTQTP